MLRFHEFEALGPAFAAMSDTSDGDTFVEALRADSFTSASAPLVDGVVLLRQVHGTEVRIAETMSRTIVDGDIALSDLTEGDAIVTGTPGLPIAVRVADCVPILLFEPEKRVGAVVHAGWHGTFDGIVVETLRVLETRYGADPRRTHCLLGPSAGPCCYEVSKDLAKRFSDKDLVTHGRHIDLWESNAIQLTQAKVPRSQIQISEICTICDEKFHSYRASGGLKHNNIVVLVL
ncbi:MAG: polyphenol oxidase family protein [Candidatus Hydrogenedentes bacterium]|nr:polyphenol oxidase family protein [Candidatus Hydrogenedentota bacterium]